MKDKEIINKEICKWEYFPEKDLRNINPNHKDGIVTKFILFWIKLLAPEVLFNEKGLYKVRYFEVVNLVTGKTRLIKKKEDLEEKGK